MADPQNNRAPRYRVGGFKVIYDTGAEFWSGPVSDASESGLFIETAHSLPLGTRVTLHPDTPEDDRLPFEIKADVVRVNEYDTERYMELASGIAVRFVGLSPERLEQLRTYLAQHGVQVRKP
jgi:PilZ domain